MFCRAPVFRIVLGMVLVLTEIVLVALFAVGVSAPSGGATEAECLVFHCIANLLIWGTAIYTQYRGVRDPANILYLIVSAGLVLFTVCAFGVYTAKVAASSADLDFGALGSPAAYAVTILSWLAALIATGELIFTIVERCRLTRPEAKITPFPPPADPQTRAARRELLLRGARARSMQGGAVDLPVTIIKVTDSDGKPVAVNGWTITESKELPEKALPEKPDGVDDDADTLVQVPLTPVETTTGRYYGRHLTV